MGIILTGAGPLKPDALVRTCIPSKIPFRSGAISKVSPSTRDER